MSSSVIDTALLLCAGIGSRLGSKTASCPKVMLPIGGKPLLQHHLEWLRAAGFRRFLINLHHMPGKITDFLDDGSRFGVEIEYSYEPALRGTGGALNGFRDTLPEHFLVHYGDIYTQMNVAALRAFHLRSGGTGALVVQPTERPHDSDIVETDAAGRVLAVHQKPGDFRFGDLGNAACKVLSRSILRYVPEGDQPCDLVSDVIASALAAGERFFVYRTDEPMFDIGTTDRLAKAAEHLLYADQ